MFRKILNANDGSDHAFKALEIACDLAAKYQAELHMILVEEAAVPSDTDLIGEVEQIKSSEDRLVRAEIRRAQSIAARHDVSLQHHILTGHVVRRVVDFANENRIDLLVIGATGHAGLYERMLGTRADRIAHLAHCPVLIVR
jgi:nucleotide-binding universal stress UspA family protein